MQLIGIIFVEIFSAFPERGVYQKLTKYRRDLAWPDLLMSTPFHFKHIGSEGL